MSLDIRDPATFQGPDAPADDDLSTCVHCGLCLNYCPTFRVTGLETESPRGRRRRSGCPGSHPWAGRFLP